MVSIFDHKQYDAKGNYSATIETRLHKTINGLDWQITVLENDLGYTYHNREVNLNLLDNKVDTDDYTYSLTHIDDSGYRHTFVYSKDKLHYYKKYNKMDADYMIDKEIPFSFDEACEFIKNEIK